MAPPNSPHCTPALTISDRSDMASISICVTAAPTSPLPPCSFLNPSSAAPFAAMIFSCSATLVRAMTVFGRVVRAEDLVGEFFPHPVLHVAPTAVQRVA